MLSLITNNYNKKTKVRTLMELFTVTGKLKKFIWQLEMFDVCTTVDTAHIDRILKRRLLDFCLHRHPVAVNCLYNARMVLSVGESFAYFARNARCTVTTDLLVWYWNIQNDFSPGATIFSLHTLASPSGRNVNYDEKLLTGGKIIWVVPSICTGFVNTCPTVFL